MERFSIGEVAELAVSARDYKCIKDNLRSLLGTDVVVASALYLRSREGFAPLWVYSIRFSDNVVGYAAPRCLRKKRPPRPECDTQSTWDLCIWHPVVLDIDRARKELKV